VGDEAQATAALGPELDATAESQQDEHHTRRREDMTDITTDIQGHCDSRFAAVRDALAEQLEHGDELGASLVVNIGGEDVIDLWGGWSDPGRTRPWERDTIVNVWSTTKTVTSLAVLMSVDRGLLDPFAPVARYWPEFAANGKEAIEVRHLMSHTSGVSAWEAPVAIEDLYDAQAASARLAAQAPWWEPGTASGYHAANYGHLLGELVRRVDGRPLKQFVAEEIAAPLGADFQIGAADADRDRIAAVVAPPPLDIDLESLGASSPAYKTFLGPAVDAGFANTDAWRRADMGAINGHGNARSVAQMLSALSLGGTVDGVRLLSPQTIDVIFQEQAHGADLVLFVPLRWGIGMAPPETETVPYVPQGRACYWGGWGGSLIVCDLDRGITFSYMMNNMAAGIIGSDRSEAYVRALESCLA
jgi:CubicO group peptidase (beta-lactamase class C family)